MTTRHWRLAQRNGLEVIVPIWPVDPAVSAFVTQRDGGFSIGRYAAAGGGGGLDLALHVGDDPARVARNREQLGIDPWWLDQRHGIDVSVPGATSAPALPMADASWTRDTDRWCAVLVADCLPVFVADRDARAVGVAHAGWRGLAGGVLEQLVGRMSTDKDTARLVAWLGPCIGPDVFEVGPEVRDAFIAAQADDALHFRPGRGDRWWADLAGLAASRLLRAGVGEVVASGLCTVNEPDRFFSYRRDGVTGRIGAFIART
ncbi:peptidoglycan editing factor PgeF [soil metagenome]